MMKRDLVKNTANIRWRWIVLVWLYIIPVSLSLLSGDQYLLILCSRQKFCKSTCADYFLEDIVQMLDFTPPPSDRKRKGGREDDDGAPPLTEGDEDGDMKEVCAYHLYLPSVIFKVVSRLGVNCILNHSLLLSFQYKSWTSSCSISLVSLNVLRAQFVQSEQQYVIS